MELIPDIPEEIDIQLQRSDYLNQKFISQVPDDNYDASELGIASTALDTTNIHFDIYPDEGGK